MFSRLMLNKNNYTCIDIMAHDSELTYQNFLKTVNNDSFLIQEDWWRWLPSQEYDIIIANDLFPNVDQRLELFLYKMLPHAKQIRLSLTYYPIPKFYITKRIDADEIMTILSYDHRQINLFMKEFANRIIGWKDSSLIDPQGLPESCYPNGRQVLLLTLKGDLHHEK